MFPSLAIISTDVLFYAGRFYICRMRMESKEERNCPWCGEPVVGRTDKRFCSDACRNDYNNALRREEEKKTRAVNRILGRNSRILARQLKAGRTTASVPDLALQAFNFKVFTSVRKRFLLRDIYWCYGYTYYITRSGIVHFKEAPMEK